MVTRVSAAGALAQWATPMPDMGTAVYRLTDGPTDHKHAYHIMSPFSSDDRMFVLLRYDRENPAADVCVVDTATGEMSVVDQTCNWEPHAAAFQHWQGDCDRVLYMTWEDDVPAVASVWPDGSDRRVFANVGPMRSGAGGPWVYSTASFEEVLPKDQIAPRDDKGVYRVNMATGERELVCSIERALSVVPYAERIKSCHLYAKMMIPHATRPRLLFNLVNAFWDRDGNEPRVRCLITVGLDGSDPVYIGQSKHHPNWHPTEDKVVVNVEDFNGKTRFGLYNGDGSGLLEYVPRTTGSGHPTFSPDGKWLFTDARSRPDGTNGLVFCDPTTGQAIEAAHFKPTPSPGYATMSAVDNRGANESVQEALARSKREPKKWLTQCHPAWSRDGTVIVFNADLGDGSQVYAVDVTRTLDGA